MMFINPSVLFLMHKSIRDYAYIKQSVYRPTYMKREKLIVPHRTKLLNFNKRVYRHRGCVYVYVVW